MDRQPTADVPRRVLKLSILGDSEIPLEALFDDGTGRAVELSIRAHHSRSNCQKIGGARVSASRTLAERLISELSETVFQPEQYEDEYRQRLLKAIEQLLGLARVARPVAREPGNLT
jgi:hypothetical protein